MKSRSKSKQLTNPIRDIETLNSETEESLSCNTTETFKTENKAARERKRDGGRNYDDEAEQIYLFFHQDIIKVVVT